MWSLAHRSPSGKSQPGIGLANADSYGCRPTALTCLVLQYNWAEESGRKQASDLAQDARLCTNWKSSWQENNTQSSALRKASRPQFAAYPAQWCQPSGIALELAVRFEWLACAGSAHRHPCTHVGHLAIRVKVCALFPNILQAHLPHSTVAYFHCAGAASVPTQRRSRHALTSLTSALVQACLLQPPISAVRPGPCRALVASQVEHSTARPQLKTLQGQHNRRLCAPVTTVPARVATHEFNIHTRHWDAHTQAGVLRSMSF